MSNLQPLDMRSTAAQKKKIDIKIDYLADFDAMVAKILNDSSHIIKASARK